MQIPHARRLLGAPVSSSDGQFLGRIGAVYLPEGRTQPLLVALPVEKATPWVVPLLGARLTADGLVLGYPTALITTGPTVDPDTPLSLGEVRAVLAHYQPAAAEAVHGMPLTERASEGADVSATAGFLHRIPVFPGIGDDDLPPIVITIPGATGLPG
ncbi:hypothetical protein [Micromonospora radicis]|uniref:PRC-barrel domain containing protein n=1 Tax=Micromonospora radicis TaxID=1894971 RepID=A0A418MTP3_9ACTN|nr:hypothetical protein [Micromonospora radicis]RIV37540.1 hypothetical protein D2L64_14995 [Micromonospora radicis]